MKFVKFNPKQLFGSKNRSTVSRSDLSFESSSSSSSVAVSSTDISGDCKTSSVVGSVTPTSVLPETSTDPSSPYSYIEILQAFKLIDKDNDGAVSKHDLESLLSRLGPDPLTDEEIKIMLREIDCDGNGTIRLEELANRIVSLDPASDSTELKETFELFDADRDGQISAGELLRVFSAIGDERCTLEECKRMIAAVDEDDTSKPIETDQITVVQIYFLGSQNRSNNQITVQIRRNKIEFLLIRKS